MTDSATVSPPDKRERLIAATRQLVHQQGVEKTTIADVAVAAAVPVGNVYYYFRTKNDLIRAAIESQADEIRAMLSSLERHRTPQARLRALIRALTDQAELTAEYGCPLGSLCSELDKRPDAVHLGCALLLELPIDWAEKQFRELGPRPPRRDARDLAVAMIASYQGIALLTNTFRDPELMTREARRLERWVDSLA